MTTAQKQERALNTTTHLMEQVTARSNLSTAYKRVVANKGAGGIDGMDVDKLREWLAHNGQEANQTTLERKLQTTTCKESRHTQATGREKTVGHPNGGG